MYSWRYYSVLGIYTRRNNVTTLLVFPIKWHRFLWLLRDLPKNKVDKLSDYSNFSEVLPSGFLDRITAYGLVCEWVSHMTMLKPPGGWRVHLSLQLELDPSRAYGIGSDHHVADLCWPADECIRDGGGAQVGRQNEVGLLRGERLDVGQGGGEKRSGLWWTAIARVEEKGQVDQRDEPYGCGGGRIILWIVRPLIEQVKIESK